MKKIGILHGKERSFPQALIERINAMNEPGITAEEVLINQVRQGEPTPYAVILDRISQDVPFYRAYLKNAALNGTASGGGYELALACDEIVLADDGSSAVSFPEAPLLGVLPGTGGLTRVVDKRKVRRDLADVFSTLAEGVRGKRSVEWRLVDEVASRSRFDEIGRAHV